MSDKLSLQLPTENIDNDASIQQNIDSSSLNPDSTQSINQEQYNSFLSDFLIRLGANKDNLTPENIKWINEFIKLSPGALKEAVDEISKLKSGNYDIQDIPHIISIIAKIYHTTYVNKNMKNPEHIITFVKFTLDSVLESNLVPLPEIEKDAIQFIIDKSLDLLSLNLGFINKTTEVMCGGGGGCIIA